MFIFLLLYNLVVTCADGQPWILDYLIYLPFLTIFTYSIQLKKSICGDILFYARWLLSPFISTDHSLHSIFAGFNYRLTYFARELSEFTCTHSLTMDEKFSIPHEAASCGIENFSFIVSEWVQVNPDNSRAISALTFLLFELNILRTKIVKLWVSRSHGVMIVVCWIYTTAITPR